MNRRVLCYVDFVSNLWAWNAAERAEQSGIQKYPEQETEGIVDTENCADRSEMARCAPVVWEQFDGYDGFCCCCKGEARKTEQL